MKRLIRSLPPLLMVAVLVAAFVSAVILREFVIEDAHRVGLVRLSLAFAVVYFLPAVVIARVLAARKK